MPILHWTCTRYVGPAHWKFSGDWIFEPNECGEEFSTVHDQEEIDEQFICVTCPQCGGELNIDADCPRIEETC